MSAVKNSNDDELHNNIYYVAALFDEDWYKENYLSKNYKGNVVNHYLSIGSKKGFNPNKFFDSKWYLNEYPDVKLAKMNPFIHYIKYGLQERRISKLFTVNEFNELGFSSDDIYFLATLFDEDWYKDKYLSKYYKGNTLDHYFNVGVKKGFNPNKFFDSKWFMNQYSDISFKNINPFLYYVKYGFKRNMVPKFWTINEFNELGFSSDDIYFLATLFDEDWYKDKYLSKYYKGNTLDHYFNVGVKKGFNPNKFFDSKWYLNEYSDVKLAKMNPFIHYIKYGFHENRFPNVNLK